MEASAGWRRESEPFEGDAGAWFLAKKSAAVAMPAPKARDMEKALLKRWRGGRARSGLGRRVGASRVFFDLFHEVGAAVAAALREG